MLRPRLGNRTEYLIKMFINRGIYKTQQDVVEAAIQALLKAQMESEAEQVAKETTSCDGMSEIQLFPKHA